MFLCLFTIAEPPSDGKCCNFDTRCYAWRDRRFAWCSLYESPLEDCSNAQKII